MKVCAVIPAAGIGSRLGLKIPKILLPVTECLTVWEILRAKLLPLVDHIHIIVSPQGESLMHEAIKLDEAAGLASISIQAEPIGMGDAIFCGHTVWQHAETILILWGDQVYISTQTLSRALATHAGNAKTIALPLSQVYKPYVEYIFDERSRLKYVKQSREGEACSSMGLSDAGTFVLSVNELQPAWINYLKNARHGSNTGEINFIPFLPYLSTNGWQVRPVKITDATESRGINTADDLNFFQNLFSQENTL